MKILVIDDEKEICQLLEDIISISISVEDIIQAANGAQGIQACLQHSFGLVVTDYEMPILNGMEFLTIMRKMETPNQAIPVIFLSSFVPVIKDSASIYDNVYFVDKPVHTKSFVNLVSMLTKRPIRAAI